MLDLWKIINQIKKPKEKILIIISKIYIVSIFNNIKVIS